MIFTATRAEYPCDGHSLASAPPMTTTAVPLERGRIDARALRTALGLFATGVAVVTTRSRSGKLAGLTAKPFAPVSLDPPLVLWGLGWWGKHMVRRMAGSDVLLIATAVDVNPSHGAFAREHGLAFAPSLDDALADPATDALILCTPHSL